ncbi:DUF192 domain-containing protein [Kaarinaea lacus]
MIRPIQKKNNTDTAYKLLVCLGIIYLLTIISCTSASGQSQSDRLAGYDVSDLEIITDNGQQLHFTVYLALTRAQRAQGLSFVTNLPTDYGMLFVFPESKIISMWMKDTPSPLDLLFIDRQGKITQIVEDTIPNSTATITSESEAYAVLEVNAGTTQRLRIAAGDKVKHALLNRTK